MRQNVLTDTEAMVLISRVNSKFKPVWDKLSPQEQVALARYFLRWGSKQEILEPTRPEVIQWYCPFGCQSEFPSGHRYCINIFTGCTHECIYCYVSGYLRACTLGQVKAKKDFSKRLDKDMADLERFNVPPAPVHLSNSTDAFQPLEEKIGHTRYALEQIFAHRKRFNTVTLLTKNPALAARKEYVELLKALGNLPTDHPKFAEFKERNLPGLVVEISLTFWRDAARAFYEPGAHSVENRIEGICALHEAGIPLVLRIDPLFPRSPLPMGQSLNDFGIPDAHTLDDLEHLVELAAKVHARHIIYSPVKIVRPCKGTISEPMLAIRQVFQILASPEKLDFHGGSWRLPSHVAKEHIVDPFLAICRKRNVAAKYCKHSLIETP
jgi:DNA repair photolyase